MNLIEEEKNMILQEIRIISIDLLVKDMKPLHNEH
jgi:hypothetical protein